MSNPWAAWLARHDTDPYVLARKEGWDAFVNTGPRPRFDTLTRAQMATLTEAELDDYSEARMVWNVNLPIVKTHQLAAAFSVMDQVLASGARDGDRSRGSVVIDAEPGLGRRRSRPGTGATCTVVSTAAAVRSPPRVTSGSRWRSSP